MFIDLNKVYFHFFIGMNIHCSHYGSMAVFEYKSPLNSNAGKTCVSHRRGDSPEGKWAIDFNIRKCAIDVLLH